MIGAGAADFCSDGFCEGDDAVVVRSDDEIIEFLTFLCSFVDVLEKRFS
ncbi:hypothetical protein N9Z09_01920 [Akkermansiaceae bacterium]|nr:hypothetical protein [Akkermansiaceae bacterium]MDB4364048.1 hypothetical protein [Akkermansiaceae bacterium]